MVVILPVILILGLSTVFCGFSSHRRLYQQNSVSAEVVDRHIDSFIICAYKTFLFTEQVANIRKCLPDTVSSGIAAHFKRTIILVNLNV